MFVIRLVNAILNESVRGQFLYMPTQEQQRENISTVFELYKLRNVIGELTDVTFLSWKNLETFPLGKLPRISSTERESPPLIHRLLEDLIKEFMIFFCPPLVPSMMELSGLCPMQGHGLKQYSLRGSCWGIVHTLRRIL